MAEWPPRIQRLPGPFRLEFLAACLHDLTALGDGGLAALMLALFVAGLAGGVAHCALMCAPFVLAQVAAGANRTLQGGALRRLSGAALVPYHLGRLVGYAWLGALMGGAAGLVSNLSGLRGWLAVPLLLAAMACLGMALERAGGIAWRIPFAGAMPPRWLGTRVAALIGDAGGRGAWADVPRGLLLGLLLSALPCGLLYGALAGAAASGSALAGALAMASFVLGTVPGLVVVGFTGRLALRRSSAWLRPAGTVLLFANALLLAAMALRQLA